MSRPDSSRSLPQLHPDTQREPHLAGIYNPAQPLSRREGPASTALNILVIQRPRSDDLIREDFGGHPKKLSLSPPAPLALITIPTP